MTTAAALTLEGGPHDGTVHVPEGRRAVCGCHPEGAYVYVVGLVAPGTEHERYEYVRAVWEVAS